MKEEKVGINGVVRYWLSDLDDNMIEGTYVEDTNTIQSNLKQNLAKAIVSGTNTDYIDVAANSFTDGAFNITGNITGTNNYGIACLNTSSGVKTTFVTSKNAGGDGTETYVEFYGYTTGSSGGGDIFSGTLDSLHLVKDVALYTGTSILTAFTKVYASYDFATTINVEANRRFHFYWRINL